MSAPSGEDRHSLNRPGPASEDEGARWRARPTRLYERPNLVLIVPAKALDIAFEVFGLYSAQRVEAGMFFYGERGVDGVSLVRAVVVPRQRNHWGNYHVDADAMTAVAAAVRPTGWRNLAQLHSHPGAFVEHSSYDDEQANSRRALSIVVPWYGTDPAVWPSAVGIHEWQSDYWHLLGGGDAEARIRVEPRLDATLIDLRP